MSSRELNILIRAKNLASGAISGVKKELGGIGKDFQRGMGKLAGNIEKGVAIGIGAAATGLTYAVKTAVDFEDAFAGVKKTIDETELSAAGLTFDSINDGLREMARTMPIAYEDLAGIAEQAGALGIKAQDIQEFTRISALLGVTTDVSSQDAATALGQLSNVLGLTGDDYDNFAATLVDLGNKGASTESQILEMATRAGAGAHLLGIANDQTLGWSAAVANLGIEVEAGGTALQKFFLESLRNLQDDKTLQVMADTAGMTADAFKKAFEKDASSALATLLKGMGDLSQAEQLAVLDALGFKDQRITRALLGLAGNTDNLTDSLNIAGQAWQDNTALTEESRKRFETSASQLQILKNNMRDVAATIGTAVLPILNDLIQEFVDWVNLDTSQAKIKKFAEDLANGIRDVVEWAKSLDWEAIGSALQTAADAGKTLLEAFLNMPSWLQGAIASGWGLNKLTGGMVGNIFGHLASGLVKGIMSMNAGVVNINAGVVNGGVPGVGGGAPVGAGVGGLLAPGLGAAAFGVGSAILMAGVIPATFKGPASDARAERTLPDGTTVKLDHATTAMMTGLMPGFQTAVKDAGGQIIDSYRDETKKMSGTIESDLDAVRSQIRDLNDPLGTMNRLQQQSVASAASSDQAMLGSLSTQTDQLRALNAKPFSANVTVNNKVDFLADIKVSATNVQSALRITQAAQQTTFSGRGGESRF